MTVIGLTGGIASGKSTAAEMLREFGATVIDADRLGHRSYEPGTPGFQKVVNAFGHDIVGKDGTVDRRVLGGKVFGAPEQMDRLNGIVWPEIRGLILEEIRQIRAQDKDAVIVLEAAVLLEAGWQDLADEVWVLTTPVKTAVERLRSRNGLSEEAAMARIESQMSNKERLEFADVKVENAGTEVELRERMEKAWTQFLNRVNRARPKGTARIVPTPVAPKSPPAKSASKSASKSGKASKPAAKAAAKPATKPKAKSATRPAAAAAKAKPTARGTAKAASTAAAKPAASKPAAKKAATTAKTTATAATKTATKTATEPATKTTKQTAPKTAVAKAPGKTTRSSARNK